MSLPKGEKSIGLHSTRASLDRKTLGAFYTPQRVARLLADWAVTDANVSVMDPSYGGCAFLYAALETLRCTGSLTPARGIYGVDIDPNACTYLRPLIEAGARPEQFVQADFFEVTPDQFGQRLFGAVIGNPPYVRHHRLTAEQQERAIGRLKSFGIQLSRRASYWAFFVLYSMQFLRRGGRLAMLLPGSFLHTDYSAQVRRSLTRYFESVTILLLQERVFQDTDEETVVVCASGARQAHQSLRLGAVKSVDDLGAVLTNPEGWTRQVVNSEEDGSLLRALVGCDETMAIYDELAQTPGYIRAGDWVVGRIGVVTGHNKFFILSPEQKETWGIPNNCLIPIIRRATLLKGLWISDDDLRSSRRRQDAYLLFAVPPDGIASEAVLDYLKHGEELGVARRRKCRDRRPWYVVQHTSAPPAFMPIMSSTWPRLVVNHSTYACTNNIMRLVWRNKRPEGDWLRLALGTLSTVSQLSAELVGRSYGGGVLKLEPGDFGRLLIPLVPSEFASSLAQKVHGLLRNGEFVEATNAVDEALLASSAQLTASVLTDLRAARDSLFSRRRGGRQPLRH